MNRSHKDFAQLADPEEDGDDDLLTAAQRLWIKAYLLLLHANTAKSPGGQRARRDIVGQQRAQALEVVDALSLRLVAQQQCSSSISLGKELTSWPRNESLLSKPRTSTTIAVVATKRKVLQLQQVVIRALLVSQALRTRRLAAPFHVPAHGNAARVEAQRVMELLGLVAQNARQTQHQPSGSLGCHPWPPL